MTDYDRLLQTFQKELIEKLNDLKALMQDIRPRGELTDLKPIPATIYYYVQYVSILAPS